MSVIAAIADDDTGATDLAGMLTAEGLRTVVVLDTVDAALLKRWSESADAIILGTASRSIARQDAYDRSYAAAKAVLALDPRVIAVKYCSTFDSTPTGNIGAAIDAAMDATGEPFTAALPALPSLGRTTYMGYHFVYDKLLSDSALRDHPLNPMRNAHLPSHLQSQTPRRVGALTGSHDQSASVIQQRLAELQSEGVAIALLDCIDDGHLERNVEAIASMRLITGSSGWAMALPRVWRRRGLVGPPATDLIPRRAAGGRGFLIVSGSCSQTTRGQNKWMAENTDCVVIHLDAALLLEKDAEDQRAIATATQALSTGKTCLITTTEVRGMAALHAEAASLGLSAVVAGERISISLASIVDGIMDAAPPEGLIIAGGETSSTLMRSLRLGGIRVGPNIEPGVPVCVALARPSLGVVLKSGNFGSPDFFLRARSAISDLPVESVSS